MSRPRISAALRQTVSLRARGCCEYCGIHEDDVNLAHEIDHSIARQHRGATTADNLAFACFHCNRLKGPNLSSIDPETTEIVRVFNPRRDNWDEHFRLDNARILALSAIGRATVALLRLNTEERPVVREALRVAGRYPYRAG